MVVAWLLQQPVCSEARALLLRVYVQLIVRKSDSNRVVGFHYCGPNAGEVTQVRLLLRTEYAKGKRCHWIIRLFPLLQGYGVALKMGATLDDVLSTVGIHPTNAEEFTVLS